MRLTFRRQSQRVAEGGVAGDQTVELTRGSVGKLVTLLAGSTTLGTFLTFVITFALRDLPAAQRDSAIRGRCLQVQVAAVALQADSADARRAGLRLLLALGALSDESGATDSLLDDSTVIPRWSSVEALGAICSSEERRRGGPEIAGSRGDLSRSVGTLSDETVSSDRQPENSLRRP